jgi:glutamyl-Q tRNA(Asp) synthetase
VSYRGRFAPSPTGPLHFGSLVAALASWLDARAAGGAWLVRIEDVDATRTVPGAADAILRALDACGLGWDEAVSWQSQRSALYEAALERLRARSLVYACGCSRREVADSALRGIEGAVYPGTCRALGLAPGADRAERLRTAGRDAVIGGVHGFTDRVHGAQSQDVGRDIGDFILRRRDGLFAYQLAVVVDDAEQGITDVVRGADLLDSSARQVMLQRALGLPTPRYLHVPVALDAHGRKLSKLHRAAALALEDPSAALAAALEFLGQPRPEALRPRELLEEAVRRWNPARIPRVRAATAALDALPGVDRGV